MSLPVNVWFTTRVGHVRAGPSGRCGLGDIACLSCSSGRFVFFWGVIIDGDLWECRSKEGGLGSSLVW